MWCKQCRQDVPALPSGDERMLCCPRCGIDLREAPTSSANDAAAFETDSLKAEETANPPLPAYDDWELDEQLRHIKRLLKTAADSGIELSANTESSDFDVTNYEQKWAVSPLFNAAGRKIEESASQKILRFDGPQARLPERHARAAKKAEETGASTGKSSVSGFFTWLALALGTTSFFFGGVLVVWSLAAGRHDLWNIGLPVALVGQIALLVGLVLQVDRLWRENREAAVKLEDVDEQVHELRTAATLFDAAHGPSSTAFYSHFAGGANPQLLLADLKSQLDLLAVKLAERS